MAKAHLRRLVVYGVTLAAVSGVGSVLSTVLALRVAHVVHLVVALGFLMCARWISAGDARGAVWTRRLSVALLLELILGTTAVWLLLGGTLFASGAGMGLAQINAGMTLLLVTGYAVSVGLYPALFLREHRRSSP